MLGLSVNQYPAAYLNNRGGKRVSFSSRADVIDPSKIIKESGNVIKYMNSKHTSSLKLKKPSNFSEGLKETGDHMMFSSWSPEELAKIGDSLDKSKFKTTKMTGLLGYGKDAMAIELDTGNVLKIGNIGKFKRKLDSFDLPVFEEGKIPKAGSQNSHYSYYIQPKADLTGIAEDHVSNVLDIIKSKGKYKVQDDLTPSNVDQVGFYNGKPYLLDRDCAVLKNS